MAKRRVRFNDHVDESKHPAYGYDMTKEERRRIWYQPLELANIQRAARELGVSVRKQRGEIQVANPISYPNVLQRTYTSCMSGVVPTRQDVHDLAYWFRVCSCRRGLEKHFCPSVTRDRLKRIEYNMDAVFAIQEQLNATRSILYEERAEMLRKASLLVSQPAGLYARIRGVADAIASMQEDRDEALARRVLEGKNKRKLRKSVPQKQVQVSTDCCFSSRRVRRRVSTQESPLKSQPSTSAQPSRGTSPIVVAV